jgi:predicted nucleotidyltransferase
MNRVIASHFSGVLVRPREVNQLVGEIARLHNPEKIILFGSYAYGEPTKDSDVDFLIVTSHRGPGSRVATRIRLSVEQKFPMDLLVYSSAELRKAVTEKDWFVIEVLEKGIVLHDRTNPAVGAKGRSRLRRRLASAPLTQT